MVWGGVDDVGGFMVVKIRRFPVVGRIGGLVVMVLVDVVGGSGELILGGGCHGGLAVVADLRLGYEDVVWVGGDGAFVFTGGDLGFWWRWWLNWFFLVVVVL